MNVTQVTLAGEILTRFGQYGQTYSPTTNQFSSIGGVAVHSVGGVPTTVYVSDSNSDYVRVWTRAL